MSTKFFNNTQGNTLFDKLQRIAHRMQGFERFLAVVGFFRSSGYFKLRKELGDVREIKILVGINIDDIFRRHNKAMLMLANEEEAKKAYDEQFRRDIVDASYAPEVEEGILQMCQDLADGRLQMRIHATKNLHAKFYLCLQRAHDEDTDGWVIMGSSNISESGLGITQSPRYELNVALKDYDDVKYCHDEFLRLWDEAVALTPEDIDAFKRKTYLGCQPTPYELYMKVLIDIFGDQVEDDFTLELPAGVKDLKYQRDAVTQGYQMLMQHSGLFLADVVGLGKTLIATMIAKRFIEANGKDTNVLVVFPPSLEDNWRHAFQLFGINRKAQFVTNGSLSKVLGGRGQYKEKEEFHLVIVDEAHGFRSDSSGKYGELQRICKAPCARPGLLGCTRKKVMLLSATPLNNRPDDLLNQLLLFQDSQACTIDGVPNLKAFFSPLIQGYNRLMRERDTRDVTKEVDGIYAELRDKVIDKVTVRRTRSNILNDADYRADIQAQGITFPSILPPNDLTYHMDGATSRLFYETLAALSDEEHPRHLGYARYRGVEFLRPEHRVKYKNAEHIGQTLAGIYRVHMVKRLESSFHAFKKSLDTLLRTTCDMLRMLEEDKVVIAPDLNVKDKLLDGWGLDEIIGHALKRGYAREDIVYRADAFEPQFAEMLRGDKAVLEALNAEWKRQEADPKLDLFLRMMQADFFDADRNASGKLVVFSESVDTLTYLHDKITKELKRGDVLTVTSKNRNSLAQTIKENFDANHATEGRRYNVILTSDVLSEGVNLHRANVIVNYDSPWNATRLMQRIGRVNRIGSTAGSIHNYMFYPSQQGDKEIRLYKNALVKLQGFHSAFGEDAQVYSREEIVRQFRLFDPDVKDMVDKRLALLREVRRLYATDRKLYHKIKALPLKSRVMRSTGKRQGQTVVYVASNVKTEFFLADEQGPRAIDILTAIDILRAKPEERAAPFDGARLHYKHVAQAVAKYKADYVEAADVAEAAVRRDLDKTSLEALAFLRQVSREHLGDSDTRQRCATLAAYVNEGIYNQLPRQLAKLARQWRADRMAPSLFADTTDIKGRIASLHQAYLTQNADERKARQGVTDPQIIISETFT